MSKQKMTGLNLRQAARGTGEKANGYFSARDVGQHLGIEAKILDLWVRKWKLIKPAVQDKRRIGRFRFSLENLASLALLRILDGYRVEPSVLSDLIKNILSEKLDVREIKASDGKSRFLLDPEKFNLWMYYRVDPGHHRASGFYLLLLMPLDGREKNIGYTFGDYEEIAALILRMKKNRRDYKDFAGIVVIDLIAIICDLEEKTGKTF